MKRELKDEGMTQAPAQTQNVGWSFGVDLSDIPWVAPSSIPFSIQQTPKNTINLPDLKGMNALHHAASKGSNQLIEELLSQGITIDACDKRGWTALHHAASNGHCDIVTQLLAKAPNLIGMFSKDRETALHCAARGGHQEVVAKLLAIHPMLVNAVQRSLNAEEESALHAAVRAGHEGIVAQLLDAGSANFYGCCRQTPLHVAASCGHAQIVERLLGSAVDSQWIYNTDSSGQTVLVTAACNGHKDIVVRLLAAEPKAIDHAPNGRNALHVAASYGHCDIVACLLAMRPSLMEELTTEGWNPLHCAVSHGQEQVVAQLLTANPGTIDTVDQNGKSVLHAAAIYNHEAIARMLLATKPELIHKVDLESETVLHSVVQAGNASKEFVAFLWGLNPHALAVRDSWGRQTPFDLALQLGRPNATEVLLMGLSVDELATAVDLWKAKRRIEGVSIARFRPQVAKQMATFLHPDVEGVVLDYLGF